MMMSIYFACYLIVTGPLDLYTNAKYTGILQTFKPSSLQSPGTMANPFSSKHLACNINSAMLLTYGMAPLRFAARHRWGKLTTVEMRTWAH